MKTFFVPHHWWNSFSGQVVLLIHFLTLVVYLLKKLPATKKNSLLVHSTYIIHTSSSVSRSLSSVTSESSPISYHVVWVWFSHFHCYHRDTWLLWQHGLWRRYKYPKAVHIYTVVLLKKIVCCCISFGKSHIFCFNIKKAWKGFKSCILNFITLQL